MPETANQDALFETLFSRLREEGFAVGCDHHLRLYQLLNSVDCKPEQLGPVLSPLFATNPWQQRRFIEIFNECYPIFITPPPKPKRRRIWAIVAALCFLLTVGLAFNNFYRQGLNDFNDGLTDFAKSLTPPTPETTTSYRTQTIDIEPLRQLPARPWVWLLVVAPVLAATLWLLVPPARKRIAIDRGQSLPPPHFWPLRIDRQGDSIYPNPTIVALSRQMRRRTIEAFSILDIAATIQATIRSGGYTQIRQRTVRRVPDYLVLIERRALNDHFAHLIDDLFELLAGQGVTIERYFFEGNARSLVSPTGTIESLDRLATRCASHRLLIFTDSDTFTHPISGKIEPWAEEIWPIWSSRAAFLTDAPGKRLQCRLKDAGFTLAPASTLGLAQVLNSWETGAEPPAFTPLPEPYDESSPWVQACALYPELNWNLSLHLSPTPVSELEISRLARADWFRDGLIPFPDREFLRKSLPKELRPTVTSKLRSLIESQPPPEGSHAHSTWQATLRLFDSTTTSETQAPIEDATLLRYLREGEHTDEAVIERENPSPISLRLAVALGAILASTILYLALPINPVAKAPTNRIAVDEKGAPAQDVIIDGNERVVTVKTPYPQWTKSWTLAGDTLRVVVGNGRPTTGPVRLDRWGSGYYLREQTGKFDVNIDYSGNATSFTMTDGKQNWSTRLPLTAALDWISPSPDGLILHIQANGPTTYNWRLEPTENRDCCKTEVKWEKDLPPVTSTITRFSANPPTLSAPGQVTLTWSTQTAPGDKVFLTPDNQVFIGVNPSGTYQSQLDSSTRFTLHIEGPKGERKASRTIPVNINQVQSKSVLVLTRLDCSAVKYPSEGVMNSFSISTTTSSRTVNADGCQKPSRLNVVLGPMPTQPFDISIYQENSRTVGQLFPLDPKQFLTRNSSVRLTHQTGYVFTFTEVEGDAKKAPPTARD